MKLNGEVGRIDSSSNIVLLDVEGTTTPVSFVYDTLFPYAREHLNRFLNRHFEKAEVGDAVDLLSVEHLQDSGSGGQPPPWDRGAASSVADYCAWLMDADRKATGLKAIQGLIWKDGYESGALKAPVFDDVVPAFKRWRKRGARIYIYSSGSVLAQKLLFTYSIRGDLTSYLSGYFDTEIGAKREPESYSKISRATACAPGELLFLSDSLAEVDAARRAGMETGLVVREQQIILENQGRHPVVSTFCLIE
jgi:enolase-phosphatase E1